MDLNVNKEFFTIITIIGTVISVIILVIILYETALPQNLNNIYTSIFSIFFIMLIGITFNYIPPQINKKNKIKLDIKFILYLIILLILTILNFFT